MTVGQVRAPPTPHHPHHIPKDRWVPTRDLARVHRKWGQHAGWHRGSRSKVPKPVPAYLHRQKEILAPPETTSPPTQSSINGKQIPKRENICVCIAGSLCCTAETNATL